MPNRLIIPVLTSGIVRLEPLDPSHTAGLRAAAVGARESVEYATVPTPETIDAFIADRLSRAADGTFWPMVQIDPASDEILGATCFLAPRWWPHRERLLAIEIGGTWLGPAARGTAVNSAAKLLLLGYAFESLGVSRVDIKTDARNARACAGIRAVGATFEGVLRNWQPSDAPGEEGRPRDTAMHAITAADWPGVRPRLEARIQAKLNRPGDTTVCPRGVR
ncbi:MAG TPA: GNAT family protein [Microbacteriaceae bacterium]|nr:GNAT family protein [Microbacteriaceae bacterium]